MERKSSQTFPLPANRLRELREVSGLRRVEIAHRCGVDPVTLGRWEQGKHGVPDEAKHILADLFGVSIPWLMGWETAA